MGWPRDPRGAVVLSVLAATCALAAPPTSPCPLVFRYEPSPSAGAGWAGVVRLLAPPKFSTLHLGVQFSAPHHLPEDPVPGTLSLRGGEAAARALVRAAQWGRRSVIEFLADFSCAVTAVPTLLNVTVNGRVFCAAGQEPADMMSTISLVADLETGLDWAPGDADFGIASEGDKVLVQGRPGSGHDRLPPEAQSPAPPCATAARPPGPGFPPPLGHDHDVLHPDVNVATGDVPAPQDYPGANVALPFGPQSQPPPPSNLPPRRTPSSEVYTLPPAPPPPPPPLPPARPSASRPPPPPPPPEPAYPPPESPATAGGSHSSPNLLFNEECGRAGGVAANPLVTKGSAAARGRWPWLVALFKKLGRRDQLGLNFECGGSLVSRMHVVTAAHCVEVRGRPADAASLVAYLGKHDLLSYTEPGQQTAEVRAVLLHPEYASSSFRNDIAVLVLADAVQLTASIRPVCLWDAAAAGGSDLDAVVGKIGAVPGWGRDDTGAISNEIRVANMPVASQEACLRSNVFYHAFTSNTTFCAGFRNGTSVCNGDSGGGLFLVDEGGRWRLRGVVSVSMFNVNEQGCDTHNYVVFTDAAKFLPWLYEHLYSTWAP